MARLAQALRPLLDLLQPLQSLAQSGHLGSADGRHYQGLRWQGSDDRYVDGAGSSARRRRKKGGGDRCMGRSRGGLTTKIHAVVDTLGRPIRLMLTAGQVHDSHGARELLVDLEAGTAVVGGL